MKSFSFGWSDALGVAIKEACPPEGYPMQLARGEAALVQAAVNQGIDSHLEACFIPGRGDSYEWHAHLPGKIGGRLVCKVSPESLPVLVRRLLEAFEADDRDLDDAENGEGMLASDICSTLGIELV